MLTLSFCLDHRIAVHAGDAELTKRTSIPLRTRKVQEDPGSISGFALNSYLSSVLLYYLLGDE